MTTARVPIRLFTNAVLFCLLSVSAICATSRHKTGDVSITDDGSIFTLSNGIVTAKFEKKTASIVGLAYKGLDLLGNRIRDQHTVLSLGACGSRFKQR
jgi:hypothetical protein